MESEPPASQLPLFDAPGDPGGAPDAAAPAAPATAAAPGGPYRPPTAGTPLRDAAGAFDDHLARIGKTANTRQAFASDLRLVAEHLGAARPIGDVTTADLDGFLAWLLTYRGQRCSPKSYARRVTTLKVFFGWLHAAEAIATDPARAVIHRKAEPPLPTVLSDAEVDRLLAAAGARGGEPEGDPRPALVVRLVLDAALKKGELARLRTADVSAGADPPTVLVRYDDPRWREKERRVAVSLHVGPLLAAYTERYRRSDGTARLFGCTDRNLEYILADLVRRARLPAATHFETLRWTSALRIWRSGDAPERLRETLGLSPITWADTQRKLEQIDDGTARGVARFFPPPAA